MSGDFVVKNINYTYKGNLYLTENWFSWNVMWTYVVCGESQFIACATCVQKDYEVIDKIAIFHKIAPNFSHGPHKYHKWTLFKPTTTL